MPYTPEMAETITGVPAALIREAAELYARGPRSATLWAMGLTQHHTGTDIVASLLNLLLVTRDDRTLGGGDDPDPRAEQRAGGERRRRDSDVYTDYQSVQDPKVRKVYAR